MNKIRLFWSVVLQVAVVISLGSLGGCDCGGTSSKCKLDSECPSGQVCDVGTGKCKPAERVPGITIQDLDPNKVNVLEEDKQDTAPDEEGFQFSVRVEATNIEAGQEAELCKLVDDGQGSKLEKDCVKESLSISGDKVVATFTDYTLDYGLQTLRVRATNKAGKTAEDQVEVRALAPNECAVSIEAPANHAVLKAEDDKDTEKPDLQYDVVASVVNVEAGNTCTLTAGDRPGIDAQPQNQTVTFQDADLPISRQPDSLALTVECTNNAGNKCSDTITIAVDLPDCQVTITPASGTFNASDDEDENTDGLQKTVTVTSEECPDGTDVTLTVNGVQEPVAQLSNHSAEFQITLQDDADRNPPGPSTVEADLSSPDGRTGHDVVQYSVDTVAPSVAITDPADGSVLGKADDYNPATADILEHDFTGTITGVTEGTVISLYIDGASDPHDSYTLTADDASSDPFQFRFRVVPLEDGTHVVKVVAQDPAGNQGQMEISLTVKLAEPGIEITDPEQAGTDPVSLGCSDDLNDQVDGLQYLVCADTANVPKGPYSSLSIDNGEPIEGTVDDSGKTCFLIALQDGEHDLTACVEVEGFEKVCSNTVTVDVDWTPPVITIDSHQDGMPVNTPSIDLVGRIEGAEDGSTVTLSVDDGNPTATTLSQGGFTFAAVNLGSEGEHNLTVSVKLDNGCEAEKSIKLLLDTTPPAVGLFLRPADNTERQADGAALVETDDLDGDCSNGFQSDVVVHVDGAAQGAEVRLWLNSATPVLGTLDDTGTAVFSGMFLKEGNNLMTARVSDMAGNEGMANATFTATCGCPVAVVEPGPGEFLTTDDDVDPSTDGVQVDVKVDTDAGQNVIFKLYVNEGKGLPCQLPEQVQTSDVNGDATFPAISLCQGENTIRIVSDDAGKVCTIAMHSVTVKLGKPSVTFADLVDGQYLNMSDQDVSGSPGFQFDVRVDTLEAEDGSEAKLVVNGTDEYTAQVTSNSATFQAVTLCSQADCPGADATLTATVKDIAGQESDTAQIMVHVDRVAPTVEIRVPDKDLLGNADDRDPLTDGLQVSVRAYVTGGNPGGDVIMTYDDGSGPVQVTATLAAENSMVEFPTVTWQDGFVNVQVTHQDAAGNTGDSGQKTYEVKTQEPELELFKGPTKLASNSFHLDPGPVWNKSDDVDPGIAGFQVDLYVQTKGLEEDIEVSVCTDNAPGVSETCRDGVNKRIATGTVIASGGGFGSVTLNTISMEEGSHNLFVEAVDKFGNYGATQAVSVTVDSIPPTIESIQLTSNDPANDQDPNLVLGKAEDLDQGASGLQASFTVTTSGVEDGQTLALQADPGGTTIATAQVTSNQVTFDSAVIPSPASLKITPVVSDAAGNQAESPPVLNVITDIVEPTVSIDVPAEGLLTQADGTNQDDDLLVDVQVSFSDDSSLIGKQLKLAQGTTERTVDIDASTPSPYIFQDFPLPQGQNIELTATLDDIAGNQGTDKNTYTVDSKAPAVSFKTPSSDVTYNATDDQGDGVEDGDLTRTDWQVAVTGVDSDTTVEILYRSWGTTNNYTVLSGATTTISSDQDPLAFTPIDLNKGEWDVIARTTDDKGNTYETSPIKVTVNIDVPKVCLEKLGGDGVCDTGDELANNGSFLVNEDEDPASGSFKSTVVIVTDAADGLDAKLLVNGVQVTPVVQTAGGTATYNGVALALMPTTNTLRAEITNSQGNTGYVEVTGIRAKEGEPTATFTIPTPGSVRTYTRADDANTSTPNLLDFNPGDVITADISNIADGQEVTLACLIQGAPATLQGTVTATVSSGSVSFPSVQFPTAHDTYSCYIEGYDEADNPINTDENIELIVDVTPPDAISDLFACIGETTNLDQDNSDPADGDCDDVGDVDQNGNGVCDTPSAADTESPACPALCLADQDNSNPADGDCDDPGDIDYNGNGVCDDTCSRRRGNVTLAWTAVSDDGGTTGTLKVKSYDVRWMVTADEANPCSDFDWDTADTTGIVLGPIADPGNTQVAYLAGAPMHKTLCFEARAIDNVDNQGPAMSSPVVRNLPFLLQLVMEGQGGSFGQNVLLNGDYDGDGKADVVAAAPMYGSNRGMVTVHYADSSRSELTILGPSDNSYFGWSIASGDVNGDTYDDLIVGAWGDASFAGRVFVFMGFSGGIAAASQSVPGEPDHVPDIIITPAAGTSYLGYGIDETPVSINGTVEDSIMLTSTNGAFVFFGNTSWSQGSNTALTTDDADISIMSGRFVSDISSADFEGDNRNDILVTIEGYAASGNGSALVFFQPDTGWPTALGPADIDVEKEGTSAYFGRKNTSGLLTDGSDADMVVFDISKYNLHSYFGVHSDQTSMTTGPVIADSSTASFGISFSITDDINNDSHNDLVVGSGGGKMMIYSDFNTSEAPQRSVTIELGGGFGTGVCSGMDYTGDSFSDIAVGNPESNGKVFVVY